jgi:hypothetical protein
MEEGACSLKPVLHAASPCSYAQEPLGISGHWASLGLIYLKVCYCGTLFILVRAASPRRWLPDSDTNCLRETERQRQSQAPERKARQRQRQRCAHASETAMHTRLSVSHTPRRLSCAHASFRCLPACERKRGMPPHSPACLPPSLPA